MGRGGVIYFRSPPRLTTIIPSLPPSVSSSRFSGETGSGKTETFKNGLSQLCHLSFVAADTKASMPIHRLIKSVGVLMESFGNAATPSNPNSSRFSKYSEIQFNQDGVVCGMKTTAYHLESARVSGSHNPSSSSSGFDSGQEKNFHIFYEMLAGLSAEEKTEWHLQDIRNFKYLNHGKVIKSSNSSSSSKKKQPKQVVELPSVEQAEVFSRSRTILSEIGVTRRRQDDIFQILAAILHLGNIEFVADENDGTSNGINNSGGSYFNAAAAAASYSKSICCMVKNKDVLELVADLLQVSSQQLEICLTTRSFFLHKDNVTDYLNLTGCQAAQNHLGTSLL